MCYLVQPMGRIRDADPEVLGKAARRRNVLDARHVLDPDRWRPRWTYHALGRPERARVTVVIATRNRRPELLRTLDRLHELPDQPPVIVVDNASADGSAAAVRDRCPGHVRMLPSMLEQRPAIPSRTGRHVPYVAFSDNDSWWSQRRWPGPRRRSRPRARPGRRPYPGRTGRTPDPVNAAMALSPLRDGGGTEVLGFLGCACVLRKEAFLRVGGFSELLFFIGEERLLSYDLAAAGWARRYLPEVIAVHEPSAIRPRPHLRRRAERRNLLLTAWLRRPAAVAAAETLRLARDAGRDPDARAAPGRGAGPAARGAAVPGAGCPPTSSVRSGCWPRPREAPGRQAGAREPGHGGRHHPEPAARAGAHAAADDGAPGTAAVIVVDNASADGSAQAAAAFPGVTVIAAARNLGAAAVTSRSSGRARPTSPSVTTTPGGSRARWTGRLTSSTPARGSRR